LCSQANRLVGGLKQGLKAMSTWQSHVLELQAAVLLDANDSTSR
jgi:hypothetical protein